MNSETNYSVPPKEPRRKFMNIEVASEAYLEHQKQPIQSILTACENGLKKGATHVAFFQNWQEGEDETIILEFSYTERESNDDFNARVAEYEKSVMVWKEETLEEEVTKTAARYKEYLALKKEFGHLA